MLPSLILYRVKMKIRIFGSDTCKNCKRVLEVLDNKGISYAFVDALSEDTQDFCDKHHVNALPHVQVVDKNDRIVFEHIGLATDARIKKIIEAASW